MLFNVLYKHRHITQEWLWEIKIAICFCFCIGFSHLRVSPRMVRGFPSPPVLTCHWHVVAKTYWEEALWQVQACPHIVTNATFLSHESRHLLAFQCSQCLSLLSATQGTFEVRFFLFSFLFWGHTNAFVMLQHNMKMFKHAFKYNVNQILHIVMFRFLNLPVAFLKKKMIIKLFYFSFIQNCEEVNQEKRASYCYGQNFNISFGERLQLLLITCTNKTRDIY